MKDKLKNNIILAIIFMLVSACVVILILLLLESIRNTTFINNLDSAVSSKIIRYRDNNGNSNVKREVLQTSSISDFINFKTTDSLIVQLQHQVSSLKRSLKKGGNVTTYVGETNVDKSSITNVFYRDSNVVYTSSYTDNWVDYSILSSIDTTNLKLKVNNKYNVVVGSEKVSLFKRVPFVNVTNYNPYSTIKDIRTYKVTIKYRKLNVVVFAGGILGKDFVIKPGIGLGIGYTLIKL